MREALTNEQLILDEEELDTLKILGDNSLTSGDQIDAQLRKVFVGGLPHNLQLNCFKKYFMNFGEIEDCVILQDKRTNKPRGFGFVTYKDIRSVNLVLKLK
jgi:RNA-binding protein Musashi